MEIYTQAVNSQSVGLALYPQLPYESDDIRDYSKAPGDFRRYAGANWNDGTTVWENDVFDVWKANSIVPGATGYLPRGKFNGGINWRAVFNNSVVYHEPGATYTGTVHPIASGTQATATGTMSAGAVNSITMVDKGAGYFQPPICTARATGLVGVVLTPVMEASAVEMYLRRGTGYAVGEVITFTGSITAEVATIRGGGSTGPIATLTLVDRGSLADPTVTTAQTANRFVQVSTTGSGSGAQILLSFRVASLTITSGGSGGPGTCTVLIDPPAVDLRLDGKITSYGRLGVQGASDRDGIYVNWFHGKSDAAISFDGKRNPGCHFDYNINLEFGTIEMDDVGNQTGFAGWAGLSIDGVSWRPAKAVKGRYVHIKKSDNNGFCVAAEIDIESVRVDAFGAGAVVTSTQYFAGSGPNSEAKGFFGYRWIGRIGHLLVNQNDQTIGAVSQYNFLCSSTGLGDNSSLPLFNFPDNTSGGTQFNNRGAAIDNITLLNVSRKGNALVDRNNDDVTCSCALAVSGRINIQPSAITAMTAGYQQLQLNPNKASGELRTALSVGGEIQILGQGPSAQGSQPGVLVDYAAILQAHIRFPFHSSGKLVDVKGIYLGNVYADGDSNFGMGSSGGPLVTFTGSDTAGSVVNVFADCGAQNFAGTVLDLNTVRDLKANVVGNNYRNAPLIKLTGATATVTITNASPGVLTWGGGSPTAHNLKPGATIVLATTGALPTGLTAGTTYYVKTTPTTTTFTLAATWGGTAINTSSAGSGTQTAKAACERVNLAARLNSLNGSETGITIAGYLIDSFLHDLRFSHIGTYGVATSSATITRCTASNVFIDDCGTATSQVTVGTFIDPQNCTGLEV